MTPEEITAAVARALAGAARCGTDRDMVTLDVAPADWPAAAACARTVVGCDYFDWLSAVDEGDGRFTVVMHVYSLAGHHHLLVRTEVPRARPVLATVTGTYRGAAWHERETHEMFGVVFDGHPDPGPLLLPAEFEGHPLRKDFPLAARAAKPWPGAVEPGEAAARPRRRVPPPGVPEGWRPA